MRQPSFAPFYNLPAVYHDTLTTPAQLSSMNIKNPIYEKTILDSLENVASEISNGYQPKAIIDFKTGDVYVEYFPVANAFEKLGLRPGPSGVSCCIMANDGSVLGVKRNVRANTCPGFLGPVAGFITASSQPATVAELISSEITEQMEHEIDLHLGEFSVKVLGIATVDYPITQSEVIVLVETYLSKEEVLKRARIAVDRGPGKIAENEAYWLSQSDLERLIAKNVSIATAHAVCLLAPLYGSPYWDKMLAKIKFLPTPDRKTIWQGLDEMIATL